MLWAVTPQARATGGGADAVDGGAREAGPAGRPAGRAPAGVVRADGGRPEPDPHRRPRALQAQDRRRPGAAQGAVSSIADGCNNRSACFVLVATVLLHADFRCDCLPVCCPLQGQKGAAPRCKSPPSDNDDVQPVGRSTLLHVRRRRSSAWTSCWRSARTASSSAPSSSTSSPAWRCVLLSHLYCPVNPRSIGALALRIVILHSASQDYIHPSLASMSKWTGCEGCLSEFAASGFP